MLSQLVILGAVFASLTSLWLAFNAFALAAAGVLTATDIYRWLPGKHFIVHDVDARFGSQPTRSMEVMGFDSAKKQYFARSFDDQGSTEAFVVALDGRRWSISGKSVRFMGSFDIQKKRLTGLWELKGRKAGWQPWIKLELARA